MQFRESGGGTAVRHPRSFQGEDQPDELFCSMGQSNIVVLALCSLFGKVSGKNGIPEADIFGSVEESVAQITGATLLHMGIAVFELSGLVSRRRHSCIGQELVG